MLVVPLLLASRAAEVGTSAPYGLPLLFFGVGLFLPGPFCNYWLDAHKRKGIALWALLVLTLTLLLLPGATLPTEAVMAMHLVRGMAYGVFQTALGSTLLIDLSHTQRRTYAAHVYYWFGRLAWALGPALGLLAVLLGVKLLHVGLGCAAAALLLLLRLDVPFRAPLDPKRCSTDRFWLLRGTPLALGLLPVSLTAGLVVAGHSSFVFYGLLMAGFFLAIFTHGLFFVHKDLRAEVTAGLALLAAAFLLQILWPAGAVVPVASVLIGWGLGLVGSRYLLLLIRVSEHCERGTAQSTYMLCREGGICIGFFIDGWLTCIDENAASWTALLLTGVAAAYYLGFAHRWFVRHRRR